MILSCMTTPVWAGGGVRSTGIKTPRVNYIVPKNDSEIDLTGKDCLTFRWKPTPRPQGGRRAYKFTLYEGFEYDVVVSEKDIKDIAEKQGFHYILTSAKTGENVGDAFIYIAYKFLETI